MLCKTQQFSKVCGLKRHLKNIHNYNPKSGDLGTVETRFFECFHCDEKFHLANKDKLSIHLINKHFPDIKVTSDWIREPKTEKTCNLVDGYFRCKKCDLVVGKYGKRINYNHVKQVRLAFIDIHNNCTAYFRYIYFSVSTSDLNSEKTPLLNIKIYTIM